MMAGKTGRPNSMETILTYENRDLSQWSIQWSTTNIPGMDDASGRPRARKLGRRRLRVGSLVLGMLLTMHCRVAAAALTGGLFVFLAVLVAAVVTLANPMRHFEVYLGQWSISGPGRAFRIIPMLDGIGIAICINAIVRAINCCFIAAIALVYVTHSVSDAELPFTYCRDFNLQSYKPTLKDIKRLRMIQSRFSMESSVEDYSDIPNITATTVGLHDNAWRHNIISNKSIARDNMAPKLKPHQIAVCNEIYAGNYPVLYDTPAYNYFYVELTHLRSDYDLGHFNLTLLISNIVIWSVMWALMIAERFRYGKLIWNNVYGWLVIIPTIWAVILCVTALTDLLSLKKSVTRLFKIGFKEVVAAIADGFEVAVYVHAASLGTEIIHGKGLNHYASGHIDPSFHAENVWHSVLLLFISFLHCVGAALCALVDSTHFTKRTSSMAESTLWIIPMYSRCTAIGTHSHFVSTLIFGGLVFSYMAVAYILLKTALHIIFEYKVKLVFVEQVVVAALILTCIALSLPFASNGGIALLDSVDALMSGVTITFLCFLELIGMLYVYRAHDFVSDMNVSMEDSVCSGRIQWQWQIIPFLSLISLFLKGLTLAQAEMPPKLLYMACVPVVAVVLAVPLRALHNGLVFMRPQPRRGS